MSNWTHPRPSLRDRLMEAATLIQFETGDRVAASVSLPSEALSEIERLQSILAELSELARMRSDPRLQAVLVKYNDSLDAEAKASKGAVVVRPSLAAG